jgi:hypothetical protein
VSAGRQLFPWPLFVPIAIAGLVVGYAIGSSSNRHAERYAEMRDWNGSRAQPEDAMRRWASKGIGGRRTPEQMWAEVHKHYSPRLMAYPNKNCIQLVLEPGAVGGDPIYCYRANSLDLVEEYSDVE